MKISLKYLMALMVMILLPTLVSAAPTTCPTATFSVYLVPGFSCMTGDILFSNFGLSSSASPSGNAIPPSGINTNPITTTGNVGFMWATGMSVVTQGGGISSFQDILLSYKATAQNGAQITDLHLAFNGSYTGTGSTSVTETYCVNGDLLTCAPGNTGQLSTTNPPANFNSVSFLPGTNLVTVSKDANASSGERGTGTISSFSNTVSYSGVPEPATTGLIGAGLVGLALVGRRRFQSVRSSR